MEREIVFLFSSCQRILYKQDVYNAVSVPDGYVIQFRYRRKYVPDEIWENPSKLEGMEAVVVAIPVKEGEPPKFIPLRKCRVLSCEAEGVLLVLRFETLPEWVDYSEEDNEYDARIKLMKNSPHRSDDKEVKNLEGYFISLGCGDFISYSETSEAWHVLISRLGKEEKFANSVFFRVRRICEISSCDNGIRMATTNKDHKVYSLKGGKRYSLDLVFDFGRQPPSDAAESRFIASTGKYIRVFPKHIDCGFRVERTSIALEVPKFFENVDTSIALRIKGRLEGPKYEIETKIVRGMLFWLPVVVVFVGLLLLSGVLGLNNWLRFFGTCLGTLGAFWLRAYRYV